MIIEPGVQLSTSAPQLSTEISTFLLYEFTIKDSTRLGLKFTTQIQFVARQAQL